SENYDIFKWLDGIRYRGYDIELAKAIAATISHQLGEGPPVTAKFASVPGGMVDLLRAAGDGRADMIMGGISKRKKREEDYKIKFSDVYFCTGQSLVYRAPEDDRLIHEMIRGKKAGFQRETTSAQLVTQLSRDGFIQPIGFDRSELVIEAVLDSGIYGVV